MSAYWATTYNPSGYSLIKHSDPRMTSCMAIEYIVNCTVQIIGIIKIYIVLAERKLNCEFFGTTLLAKMY